MIPLLTRMTAPGCTTEQRPDCRKRQSDAPRLVNSRTAQACEPSDTILGVFEEGPKRVVAKSRSTTLGLLMRTAALGAYRKTVLFTHRLANQLAGSSVVPRAP